MTDARADAIKAMARIIRPQRRSDSTSEEIAERCLNAALKVLSAAKPARPEQR